MSSYLEIKATEAPLKLNVTSVAVPQYHNKTELGESNETAHCILNLTSKCPRLRRLDLPLYLLSCFEFRKLGLASY